MKFRALIGFLVLFNGVGFAESPASAAPAATPATPPAGAAAPVPQAPPATQDPTVGANYLIGPGDTIQVFVWRNPELTVSVPVRPDGKVSTPLVEDMVAVSKTPS